MSLYKILCVCTGNICRSPTAEAMLRAQLEQAGLASRVMVDSAGTHGYHVGEPPDARSITHAKKRGIDLSALRARRIGAEDFHTFDLILALDDSHYRLLMQEYARQNAPKAQVALLLDYAGHNSVREVPDPYYGDGRDFEYVLDLLEAASAQLVKKLQDTLQG